MMASCKSALYPRCLVVYSTDHSKASVRVLVLLIFALCFVCFYFVYFVVFFLLLFFFVCFFCFTLCNFVLVLFSPFSIAITSLGEEKTNLIAYRTFV